MSAIRNNKLTSNAGSHAVCLQDAYRINMARLYNDNTNSAVFIVHVRISSYHITVSHVFKRNHYSIIFFI